MPYLDENPLQMLAFQPGDAEATLDLHGLSPEQALARLDHLLDTRGGASRYLVVFDEARTDGTETLFQPIGRYLLQARRNGRLKQVLPIAKGNGFYFEKAD